MSEAITMAGADQDGIELAVREHARLVYRVTDSVLRNHHDAEDAPQETFIRVLRTAGSPSACAIREPGWLGSHGGSRWAGDKRP